MALWDNMWGGLTRGDQGFGSGIADAASKVYGWGKDNPLDALSLGMGAVGTGMGIWDLYQANQRARDRQKLAEQYARMGPGAFALNYSPDQLQSMYFRPAAQNMAFAGQTDGGSFRQALADAALKAESDRIQLGNQIFQSRVSSLGYGPVQGPTGNTGAFGGALQNLMLRRAMQQYPAPQQQAPGATVSPVQYAGLPGQNMGTPASSEYNYAQNAGLGQIPGMQLQSGLDPSTYVPNPQLQFGASQGGISMWGGDPSSGFYPSSAFEGQYQ